MSSSFHIIIDTTVQEEFSTAKKYYRKINKRLSSRLSDDFEQTVQSLTAFWASEVKYRQVRRRLLKSFPYSIYFRVDEPNAIIYIEAFIHNSRQQPGDTQ